MPPGDNDTMQQMAGDIGELKGTVKSVEKWMEKIDGKVDRINLTCSQRGAEIHALKDKTDEHIEDKAIHLTVEQISFKMIGVIVAISTILIEGIQFVLNR